MSIRYPGDTEDALSIADGMPWYLSPDIWLNTAVANIGANVVNLRTHLTRGRSFPASQAEIEVFVGNPSLVMSPTSGTIPIGTTLVARADLVASPTGAVETTLTWNVPPIDSAHPDRPDQPGHRCLIARVYPFGSATPADFQVVTDQHEAQRNICIAECADDGAGVGGAGGGLAGAPGTALGRGEDGLWTFAVDTTTPGREEAETVAITATVVARFTPAEQELVLPRLEPTGFIRLAAEPPPATKLEFLTAEQVLDCPQPQQGVRVDVTLEPGRTARLAVKVDLKTTAVHEAQALKVEQVGEAGDLQGGVLLVFHRVA